MRMLDWAVNVLVGWLGASVIAMAVIYFVVAENDREIVVPLGIFFGFLIGAVAGAKSRIVRLY